MSRPVSLSVHKNSRARRHAKDLRDEINLCVADAQQAFGTQWCGYALVTWDENGSALANWNGVKPLAGCPIEEYLKNIIGRARAKRDTRDILYPEDDGAS
jgi:hypothetical protein